MTMRKTCEVIVGNIGTVYSGTDRQAALRKYWLYCGRSKIGDGYAADEPVSMLCDGEIVFEYAGNEDECRAENVMPENDAACQLICHQLAFIKWHKMPSVRPGGKPYFFNAWSEPDHKHIGSIVWNRGTQSYAVEYSGRDLGTVTAVATGKRRIRDAHRAQS